jgi:hypothetical protein
VAEGASESMALRAAPALGSLSHAPFLSLSFPTCKTHAMTEADWALSLLNSQAGRIMGTKLKINETSEV